MRLCESVDCFQRVLSENVCRKHLLQKRNGVEIIRRVDVIEPPNGNAKRLTKTSAQAIRRMWNTGKYTQAYLAELYGVSQGSVSNVCRGETWADGEPMRSAGELAQEEARVANARSLIEKNPRYRSAGGGRQ